MKYKDLTKRQLIDELAELRQRNNKLEIALEKQRQNCKTLETSSPHRWFSTGSAELFVSKQTEQQPAIGCSVKYRFSDLVNISLMQKLSTLFYTATGIPHAVIDIDSIVLSGIGWQDICTRFHRVCPQTECRCKESDSYISSHLHEGPYIGYKCLNGLIEYATPIIVEGQHLANVFLGQLLHEPPDEEFFRRQAQRYGFEEAAYMEALHRVPIIPEKQVESIMDFFSQLGKLLATMGLERKRQLEAADQTVREQQEQLNLIWKTSNDVFWEWNIKTDQICLSPRWARISEYLLKESELSFELLKKYVHPDDVGAVMKVIREHLVGRTEKFEAEYRIMYKNGEWRWIMAHGQTVEWDAENQPLRMIGICIDNTGRKKAEAALSQSEQKFRKAFQGDSDIMTISTLGEGRYVAVNDAFVELSGYKRQEAIGHTSRELNLWAVPEERDYLLRQIREHGNVRAFELELRGKSGEIRICDFSGEAIDIEGEEHILCRIRDISKSKRIEEALRFSEECFSKAFNASPILMSITTLEAGRFIKVNRAFDRFIGYDHDEVIGRTSFEIGFWLNPGDRHLVQQSIMAGKSVRDMEVGFRKKNGEHRLGLYSAERLDISGEICILSTLTDISDFRKMEVEMTRLDRLNVVGEMAASIGHEVRNPMTTVRGYLQLLREKKDYDQEIEYFDMMIEELDRANSIISEFLSLAKNKMVDMTPGNLNSIINKSLPLIQAKAISRDQYIKLETNELPDLLLDAKGIRQLVINLVNNGLEAMYSRGVVTIRTFLEENNVVLEVRDEGHGIDRELLDKLGTPFFTTKEQGTGLGLAVCYRIATVHNAKINIETGSTGTTFYVKFPISAENVTVIG
ncbi:MAG: PocR ligand-binding domain-containing protein [Syntrophomonas sp.]